MMSNKMLSINVYALVALSSLLLIKNVMANNLAETLTEPSHVEIVHSNGMYQMLVNNKPFVVKGAGINYVDGHNYEALVAAGGNSFRTWSTDYADIELAAAAKNNLMVALGFNLEKELHHFDYNDENAVAQQFEQLKHVVNRYKNHPNLLVWVVANEPNLLINNDGSLGVVNPKVYDAISDIIDYIHQVDPHHPVTYSFAGVIKEHIEVALSRTPQVDFVSLQVYGDLDKIPEKIKAAGIVKPFMITEFGPMGHWEMPSTQWGREIEEPSGIKAASMAKRIAHGLAGNPTKLNIGHYVFEWGQKQERTPTWYGMFNKDGKATARIDEITKYWTGQYPDNRAPLASDILINGHRGVDNINLKPNQTITAKVIVTDPENDLLRYDWVLLKEVQERSEGGAIELEPEVVELTLVNNTANMQGELTFLSPRIPGDYRLFSYTYDDNKVANANIPFYVTAKNN